MRVPEQVSAGAVKVWAWRPDLKRLRFWTQFFVVITYLLHAVWAAVWLWEGLHPYLLEMTPWWSFLIALTLVLVYHARDREGFVRLLPIQAWAALMMIGIVVIWLGLQYSQYGNGKIVFWGWAGVAAPLIGEVLDLRGQRAKLREAQQRDITAKAADDPTLPPAEGTDAMPYDR